jgi:hypothetical protein
MIEAEDRKDISLESAIGAGSGGLALSSVGEVEGVFEGCVDDAEEVEAYVGSAGRAEIISCIFRAKDICDGGRST